MNDGRAVIGIEAGLAPHGLALRGGFDFATGETAPAGPEGRAARSLLLIGNIGSGFWSHFAEWRATQAPAPNPLDRWTRQIIDPLAVRFGAAAVYPSDKPYQPFQQWAIRAERLKASPLGLLIHPEYGLWHAYRAALLFDRPLHLSAGEAGSHPCDACVDQPCLHACPISAHRLDGFDYQGCKDWQKSTAGSVCRLDGCLDRNACPVGAQYRYSKQFQAFLADAFIGA